MANRTRTSAVARLSIVGVLLFSAATACADTLFVRVVGVDQQPVPDVAVFVKQLGSRRGTRSPDPAVMDQRDQRFEPHLLMVQKGAEVAFPNSDVIAHHVYSFSKPNNFVLPLYKGTPPEPVRFDHDGIVTLGCNIHDAMLAYIVVVDTDIFAMTDAEGIARLEVDDDATKWQVHAWSPRFRDSREPLVRNIRSGEALTATFALTKKLRPAHDERSESVHWNDYN